MSLVIDSGPSRVSECETSLRQTPTARAPDPKCARSELRADVINRFQVWVRPLGSNATKVKVVGQENATWLRERLQNEGVTCTESTGIPRTSYHVFQVLHALRVNHPKLRTILTALPEVELMLDPA